MSPLQSALAAIGAIFAVAMAIKLTRHQQRIQHARKRHAARLRLIQSERDRKHQLNTSTRWSD